MIRSNLIALLAKKEMTIADLAQAIDTRYATIWSLANNKTERVNFATLDRLCKELSCDVGDLLEYISTTPNKRKKKI